MTYESWGKYPKAKPANIQPIGWASEPFTFHSNQKFLAYGQGRSYGDCCLNPGETIIPTQRLRHVVAFDFKEGWIEAEAGITLAEILDLIVPKGWFLPVTPGTKFVTLGGAIANDVHGKNHHRAGTLGCHVESFLLLRSDGQKLHCSLSENEDYYRATIGGLGLTGLILNAKLKLKSIRSSYIESETIKFENLDEFFELSKDSDCDYEYTVAWLDCVAQGEQFGRGHFIRGNHAENEELGLSTHSEKKIPVPVNAPNFLLNRTTIKTFNQLYFHKQKEKKKSAVVHYDPFFYPLDSISDWNKIYGHRGFLQYQCVVPLDEDGKTIKGILKKITDSGLGSFLAVIKMFGEKPSPGLLSFPKPGVTLALDFAFQKDKLIPLLHQLDEAVRSVGGRVYPAKDACMTPESYRAFFPQNEEFKIYQDPLFSSGLWRRVQGEETL